MQAMRTAGEHKEERKTVKEVMVTMKLTTKVQFFFVEWWAW